MAEEYTSKFKIDISDLQKNIRQAQEDIKAANATFKAETAGMDNWAKNADGLSAKLKSLDTVLDGQKRILSSYEDELERNQKAYEENGKRSEDLRKKLAELREAGIEKTSEEYKKYETALKDTIKEQEKNGKAVSDLKMKVLQQKAAVGETEGALRKYQEAERKVESDSKSLTKTVESQQKDLKKLKGEYADVIAAEGKNSASAKDLEKQIRDLSSSLDANQKELDQSRAEADKLDASFEKAEKSGGGLAGKLAGGLKKGLVAVGTAAASAVAGLAAASVSTGAYADEILTLSAKTGIGTDELEAYKYAADLVEVSMETMTGSMAKNVKSMVSASSGTGAMAEAYQKLGVSVTDSDGKLRDSKQVYWELIDALGTIEDDTERDAIAMQIFGKSAQDLNPLIQAGSEKIADLTQEAKDMGVVMGGDALKKAGQFQDSVDRLKGTAEGVKNALGMVLMPALEGLATDGTSLLGDFTKALNDANGDWGKISEAIGKLVEGAATALMERLPQILEIGMNIATGLIKALTNKNLIKSIIQTIVKAVPDIIKAGIELFSGLVQAIPEVVKAIIEELPSIALAVVDGLKRAAGDVADAALEFFFGIQNESKLAQQALDDAGKAAGDYVRTLKGLEPDLVDYTKIISDQGHTIDDLDDEYKETEDKIYEILKQAFADQEGLREQDLKDIENYMTRLRELNDEKIGIYQMVQEGERTKISLLGPDATPEEIFQAVANAKGAQEETTAAVEKGYTDRLALTENEWRARGEIDSEGYQQALAQEQAYHDAQIEASNRTYENTLAIAEQRAIEWVQQDRQMYADLAKAGDGWREASEDDFERFIVSAGDWLGIFDDYHEEYRGMLETLDKENGAAFLAMVGQIKSSGKDISEETNDIAKDMLLSFLGLPQGLSEVGKETLLGLTAGLEGQIPGLENAASMTVDEIVQTIMQGLDIHSPSKVMEDIGGNVDLGLISGIDKGLPQIKQTAGNAAVGIMQAMLLKLREGTQTFYQAGQSLADAMKKGMLSREETIRAELAAMLNRVSANLTVSAGVNPGARGTNQGTTGGTQNVTNFTQNIYAPESPSRLELYRQTQDLLRLAE